MNPTWPPTTRFAARAAERGGYRFTELDDDGGYLFCLSDGRRDVYIATGSVSMYPLNSQTAAGLCKDKYFCSKVLAREGVPHVPGQLFFVTGKYSAARGPGREKADLLSFADDNLPFFLKPNQGSRGNFAEAITSKVQLECFLDQVSADYHQVLVQDIIEAEEYRVLVLNGRAVFQYRRGEAEVRGDGKSSWAEIFEALNANLHSRGLSPVQYDHMFKALAAIDAAPNETSTNVSLTLTGRRNVSSGGRVIDFKTDPDPAFADLACRAASALDLKIAGVDIFEIPSPDGPPKLQVLEVNANPSIASLEKIGETGLAEDIWMEILETLFAAP